MLLYWVWLACHPALTDREKGILLTRGLDPEALFFTGDPVPPETEELVRKARAYPDLAPARQVLEDCAHCGLQVVPYAGEAYPKRLKNISDPPAVLFCRGKLPELNDRAVIGVVGTRKASAYGMNTAYRMGYQIARCGGIVVSGMAMGVDAMSMQGAMAAGSTVVGVLGCGPEQVYPKSNKGLFADTERFGCILSEYPPGTPPSKWKFPRRNRIISGLSCGILVVEAPEKSGSLITAGQAAEQGRDVFVVPGNIDLPGFAGSYRLLREGAIPVKCGWDVLCEYENQFPGRLHREQGEPPDLPSGKTGEAAPAPAQKPPVSPAPMKKDIDKAPKPPYIGLNELLSRLTPEEQAICQALRQGQRLVDDVIAETGLSTGKMLSSMTMLEIKGVLRRLPGKRIALLYSIETETE